MEGLELEPGTYISVIGDLFRGATEKRQNGFEYLLFLYQERILDI